MTAGLTTAFRLRHPEVKFTILSRKSAEILTLLENLEIDAGLTYLDNEPLGRGVNALPLYQESYRLLAAPSSILGSRERVTWAEVAEVPLCLLTPDMQNRRIIDRFLKSQEKAVSPMLESDSMIALYAHVKTGYWASVMPDRLADTIGDSEAVRAIPIVDPEVIHTIGLVVPHREPMSPLTAALVEIAKKFAPQFAV
jgi:DNA-binding transcriptional LysR family regulator